MRGATRIGLALGSGSARGLAHIGVLEVLREEGVPLHCIAGTSIGAVIGGLWATESVEAYKAILRDLPWWRIAAYFEPALSRSGLFSGGKLIDTLRDLTGEPRIEDLDLRYVAVATDAETGQEVRLFRGDLVQAMRASFAIPALFTPVRWEERWLVDGGVAAPVPVEAAHALGATHVIAVNLNTRSALQASAGLDPGHDVVAGPVAVGVDETVCVGVPVLQSALHLDPMTSAELPVLDPSQFDDLSRTVAIPRPQAAREPGPEPGDDGGGWIGRILHRASGDEPPGLAQTLTRSLDWMQVALAELQMARARPDVVIEPQCGDVRLFDYDRSLEVIEAGRRAAREALPAIRALL